MKAWIGLASRALLPVILVSGVVIASYFSPVKLNGTNLGIICTYTSPIPSVTSISPNSGTANGGTTVTITGSQFCNGTVTVHFGAAAATGVVVNSNTQVTATSPAGTIASTVHVTVTTAGGTSASTSADLYTYTQPPCATAGLSANKASPQPSGTVITFTATSTGCNNPEYQFWLQLPNGAWMLQQSYDGATWAWNTAGLANGNYVANVWVRQLGSGRTVDANQLMPYSIGAGPACTAAGLTSDKASPQQVDFTITFTATSSTCSNPEYLFYLQLPNGAWTIARGYGGPVWAWDTSTVAAIGNYVVNVWVRAAGSGVAVETNHLMPFTITDRVCTAAGLSSSMASPQAHGPVITFTGTSASCARPEYLFYLKGPGVNGTWSIVQGYDGTTWAWNTAGVASIGTYEVNVWVRAHGSPSSVQTNAVMFYTLT